MWKKFISTKVVSQNIKKKLIYEKIVDTNITYSKNNINGSISYFIFSNYRKKRYHFRRQKVVKNGSIKE